MISRSSSSSALSGTTQVSPIASMNDLVLQDEDLKTTGNFTTEGRVSLDINQKHSVLSRLVAPHLPKCPSLPAQGGPVASNELWLPKWLTGEDHPPPPMNVVIQIVGSRGDVQPFIALGKTLKEQYGHRVRLATHAVFKKFVEENGLQFFNIGGDPANLMDYMVKNPGLIPGKASLKHGDVGKRKKEIKEIMEGCWRSCIDAGDGMSDSDDEDDDPERWRPFVANAIIANPPGFAHIHCAEKLGVPLHLVFTMPWTPTQAFPHPLANVHSTGTDPNVANWLSYPLVMMLTWQGLGGIINEFRENRLGLQAVSVMWTPIVASTSKLPFTYCWSPALIPKPSDWSENVHVAGFCFLPLASSFTPDPSLLKFLEDGPPPVYIGFGSIVVADPNAMTKVIFDAVEKAGVRALVSKGWGGFGGDALQVPENIYMLGNVPHDWLFQHVSAVCHHGGAGTTAAGIAAGKPTIVVPFFGDQPFWGAMVHRAGAGPVPIPHKQLTAEKLADAIRICLDTETQAAAQRMGEQISQENGPDVAGKHFHSMLPLDRMRCALEPKGKAVWRLRQTNIRISAFAAAVLVDEDIIDLQDLKLNRCREYDLSEQPFDPISGSVSAVLGTLANFMTGTATIPTDIIKQIRSHDKKVQYQKSSDAISSPTKTSTRVRSGLTSTTVNTLHEEGRVDYVHEAAEVIIKDLKHLANLPRELTVGLARGFHNAPKLYGDDTVRKHEKITDLRTGLKGAGKELGFGLYDAFTGVVTQPINGAKKQGLLGFFKGLGKGIGGLALKPEAAILGALAYTWEGLYRQKEHHIREHKELRFGSHMTLEQQIASTWLLEGHEAFLKSTEADRGAIMLNWHRLQAQQLDRLQREAAAAHCPIEDLMAKVGTQKSMSTVFKRRSSSTSSRRSIDGGRPSDRTPEEGIIRRSTSRDGSPRRNHEHKYMFRSSTDKMWSGMQASAVEDYKPHQRRAATDSLASSDTLTEG